MTQDIASLRASFTADNTDFNKKAQAVKEYLKDIQKEAKQQMAVQKQQAQAEKQWAKEAEQAEKAKAKAAKDAERQAAQAAREQKKNWQDQINSLKKMAVAAIAAGVALKKVYDIGKQGAQLEYTTLKFDRLAKTIGTTGDALTGKLQVATKGTMSNMELMSSATDILSLGLVKNEKDVVRLATVMGGLGMDMNQLVLTLSNQTTMRFDQLGVSVAGFKDKVTELKAAGMDANSAFTEAFLQQAEMQLEKVGNAADTTLGSFQKFEAGIKNLTDTAKVAVANGLLPIIDAINKSNSAIQKSRSDVELYNMMLASQGKSLILSRVQFNMAKDDIEKYANTYNRLNAMSQSYAESLKSNVIEPTQSASMTQDQFNVSMQNLSNIMDSRLTNSVEDYQSKMKDLNYQLDHTYTKQGKADLTAQIDAETKAYEEQTKAIMFNIEQKALMAAAESGKITYDQANQATLALAQNLGMIDENTAKTYEVVGQLIDRFGETGSMDEFNSGLDALNTLTVELPTQIGDSADSAQVMNDKLSSMIDLLNQLPPSGTNFGYTFTVDTQGNVSLGAGSSGGTPSAPPKPKIQQAMASGGQMYGGWTLTGEAGPELISPTGYVFNANATRQLLQSGSVQQYAPRRIGGSLDDPTYDPTDSLVFGPTGSANALSSPLYTSTSTHNTSHNTSASASTAQTVSNVVSASLPPVIAMVSQMVGQQSVQLQTSVEKMTRETQSMVAELRKLVAKTPTAQAIGAATTSINSRWNA